MLLDRKIIVLVIGLVTIASGCSGRKAVKVLVKMDGTPVEGATVSLVPDGKGSAASGVTGKDGTAALDTPKKDGVEVGTYKVLVTKVKALSTGAGDPKDPEGMKSAMMKAAQGGSPKSELPDVYSTAAKTPLTLKVPPDSSPAPLDLKSKP